MRGLAALFVGLSHLLALQVLDPGWTIPIPLRFLQCGHSAVLVFFLLSGYVIGLTTKKPYSSDAAADYLRRRAVRIVPIYLVALLFTLFVNKNYTWQQVAGCLLFFQNFDSYFGLHLLPLQTNGPIWSLNYEVLYYLLFLFLWRKRATLSAQVWACLLLGAVAWSVPHAPVFLCSYAVGWLFWMSGWWLSEQPPSLDASRRLPLLSVVLLLLSAHHFECGVLLLNTLHIPHQDPVGVVNIGNLALLPICCLCLITVTRHTVSKILYRALATAAFALPIGALLVLIGLGRLQENPRWIAAATYAVLAVIAALLPETKGIARLAPFGRISYGFYLIHFPMLFLVERLHLPGGTGASFLLRAVIWFGLSLFAAWLLECRFQPMIRKRIFPAGKLARQ